MHSLVKTILILSKCTVQEQKKCSSISLRLSLNITHLKTQQDVFGDVRTSSFGTVEMFETHSVEIFCRSNLISC
jgi:hypothetical protein